MTKTRSISSARNALPQLVREAEAGEAIELTRRGEPVAVLLGRREYERLASGTRRFSEAWEEFRRSVDLCELDIDPDEVFASVRSRETGRATRL